MTNNTDNDLWGKRLPRMTTTANQVLIIEFPNKMKYAFHHGNLIAILAPHTTRGWVVRHASAPAEALDTLDPDKKSRLTAYQFQILYIDSIIYYQQEYGYANGPLYDNADRLLAEKWDPRHYETPEDLDWYDQRQLARITGSDK